jgi:putative salt-induced outer membrane protein YdiY
METEYAGTIEIDMNRIASLTTDAPVSSKLEDDTVVTGEMAIQEDGYLTIDNQNVNVRVPVEQLTASWLPDATPPVEAGFPQARAWHYTVGADITGKRGNSKESGTSIRGEASLVSDDDELRFYISMDRADNDGEKTSDEVIFGSSYVSYFSDLIGWYVGTELERDPFESIDLRASASAGLSYWLVEEADFNLELQSGLGFRHESFEDGTNENSPTLDIKLLNEWHINSWMDMTNMLSYSPSITDLDDYLLVQDSGINMPIGASRWSLRLGLKNNYKSEPAVGRKKLDTTYYSRLLLSF